MNYQQIFEQEILTYAKKHGPKEWHSIATNWGYVFGNEPIKWIVNQKEAYLATILELYWDSRIENYLGIREVPTSVKDELKLHAEVIELIEANIQKPDYYQDIFYAFEVKPDRYDLSKTTHPIPERLKHSTKTEHDEERPEYFYDGAPDEVFDKIMKPAIERAEKYPIQNTPKYWVFADNIHYYRSQMISHTITKVEYIQNGKVIEITEQDSAQKIVHAMGSRRETITEDYTFTFQRDKKWPIYDLNGQIYSERLVDLYQKFGVKLKRYPVKLVDKENNPLELGSYFMIKMVEPFLDALNEHESLFVGSNSIGVKRIILDAEKTQNEPIFLLQKLYKLMMRDDIVQEIFKQKITGYWFVEAENWHSGKYGTNFVEGGRIIT